MKFTSKHKTIRTNQNDPTSMPSPESNAQAVKPPALGMDIVDNQTIQRVSASQPKSSTPVPENKTGLPDNLKAGIESLSGYSVNDVKVHYNSPKPAQLQALAYTQGTDIHIAPGQQQHLPHEAWHVVQQKQGLVQPTIQAKGIQLNNNGYFEAEADKLGVRAHKIGEQTTNSKGAFLANQTVNSSSTIQLKAKIKRNPKYAQANRIQKGFTRSGYSMGGSLDFEAEFETKGKDVHPAHGEIRQYIMWTDPWSVENHQKLGALKKRTHRWHEDRDDDDIRYGHRHGDHSDLKNGDNYYDGNNQADGVNGHIYRGVDNPTANRVRGQWYFKLVAIDTSQGGKEIGHESLATIDFEPYGGNRADPPGWYLENQEDHEDEDLADPKPII